MQTRRFYSQAILEDLDTIKRGQEWGAHGAKLKPSVSALDLPRSPYDERRQTLYASVPFVAVPGMTARTNHVVRQISYRMYVAEREQYGSMISEDEAKAAALGSLQERAERLGTGAGGRRLSRGSLEMRRMGSLKDLFGTHHEAMMASRYPERSTGLLAKCRSALCVGGSDIVTDEDINLALAPRSKEEEALYVECQIAEDELRRDIVTAPMIMACLVACVSQFLSGFNTSVMNAPEKYVFPGHSTLAWSLAVSSFAIGGPVGAILGGYLANAAGRRQALLFDAIVFVLGGLLMSLAPTIAWLIAGRFFVGIASGFASVLVPVYLGELAPPVLRGTFGTCTQFAMVLGILASDLLAFELAESWRILFGVTPLLAFLQLLCAPHLLESPRWLLDRDENSQDARLALQLLYGFRDVEQIEHEVSHIVGATAYYNLAAQESGPPVSALRSIYEDPLVRPLMLSSIALHVAQQLCGINSVFYYSTMFFNGIIDNPLLGTTLVAGINVVATYLAIILMDQCGRKALLAWSSTGMLICVIIITAVLYEIITFKFIALLAVMAYVSFFEIGLGPIPWLSQAEIFESRHVDAAQSVACQVNWICNFLVGCTFPTLNKALGPAVFFTFWFSSFFNSPLRNIPFSRNSWCIN
mmetsp:Transcript_13917/g.20893  ORF Transcript_13917/g.20893 Transcript_13917/m.20893 type:complete len:642 (-) Transcript_13917:1518-3443(-)